MSSVFRLCANATYANLSAPFTCAGGGWHPPPLGAHRRPLLDNAPIIVNDTSASYVCRSVCAHKAAVDATCRALAAQAAFHALRKSLQPSKLLLTLEPKVLGQLRTWFFTQTSTPLHGHICAAGKSSLHVLARRSASLFCCTAAKERHPSQRPHCHGGSACFFQAGSNSRSTEYSLGKSWSMWFWLPW